LIDYLKRSYRTPSFPGAIDSLDHWPKNISGYPSTTDAENNQNHPYKVVTSLKKLSYLERGVPMLKPCHAILYQRLQEFDLDNPTHEFGFTRHLMKSHGWTLMYSQRVIAEYKKFVFLTMVANHQVVPSDQVDQVWHAHLLLTESYWDDFCPNILEKPLHHHPAKGGRTERAEFHLLYVETINSYRHFFGSPPTDIWSSPDQRFGVELKTQRVNLGENWLIPKKMPRLHFTKASIIVAITTLLTFGYVEAVQAINPRLVENYKFTDQPLVIIALSMVFGLVLRYFIRLPRKGLQAPQVDIYEAAYLAGGASRAVELAIVQLVHQGYLCPNVRNRTFSIEKKLSSTAAHLEQKVMQQAHLNPDFKSLRLPGNYETDFLRRKLRQDKLLIPGEGGLSILVLVRILIGILVIFLGDKIDYPVLVAFVVNICCIIPYERTHWGGLIFEKLQINHDSYNVNERFAIYGYETLSGGTLDDLKRIFKEEAEADAGGCGCGC
jgi:uncharacterized protein (TIGR04222 family)